MIKALTVPQNRHPVTSCWAEPNSKKSQRASFSAFLAGIQKSVCLDGAWPVRRRAAVNTT